MIKKGLDLAHPEGLTTLQEQLAIRLISTGIEAKVKRRFQLPNGAYRFEDINRLTSPVDFAHEGEFALKLHERTPEAPLSPYYINLRNLQPEILELVGQVLAEMTGDQKPDFCAGIPKAGVPLARAYAEAAGIESIDCFSKVQTEGGRRIVVDGGNLGKRRVIRLVDDLVTKAETKMEAITAAKNAGYRVADIFVLIDRQQGGIEQLEKEGFKLKAAFNITQLFDFYLRTGMIDYDQHRTAIIYTANNK